MFLGQEIETIFLKIRTQNIRSKKAVEKLPYVKIANERYEQVYQSINHSQQRYDLYSVERSDFLESSGGIQHGVAT